MTIFTLLFVTFIVAATANATPLKPPSNDDKTATVNVGDLSPAAKKSTLPTEAEKSAAAQVAKRAAVSPKRSKRDALVPLEMAVQGGESPIDALGLSDEQWESLAGLVHTWEAERRLRAEAETEQLYAQYMNRFAYGLPDEASVEEVEIVPLVVDDGEEEEVAPATGAVAMVPVAVQDDDGNIYPIGDSDDLDAGEPPIRIERRAAAPFQLQEPDDEPPVLLEPIGVIDIPDEEDASNAAALEAAVENAERAAIAEQMADELAGEQAENELVDELAADEELRQRIDVLAGMMAQRQRRSSANYVPVLVV